MAVCPSVDIYRSGLHWTDSRQIWLCGLYGNLLSNRKFVWNGSNTSAIATTAAQSRDCGQDQVFCVCCVVLRIVQYRAHFNCYDSVGRLFDVCIIMCWDDTHTHTHTRAGTYPFYVSVYMHTNAWQRFSDVVFYCEPTVGTVRSSIGSVGWMTAHHVFWIYSCKGRAEDGDLIAIRWTVQSLLSAEIVTDTGIKWTEPTVSRS